MEIPLPPLPEQRRIVARIEELAAKIEEAQTLRRRAVEEGERLLTAMAHRSDLDKASKHEGGWREVELGEVLEQLQDRQQVDLTAALIRVDPEANSRRGRTTLPHLRA